MKELIKEIKKGQEVLIQNGEEKEIVTIGDIGRIYTDVIFENGDLRKVILEDVFIEECYKTDKALEEMESYGWFNIFG